MAGDEDTHILLRRGGRSGMLRSGLSALKSGGLNCERGSTLPLRLCRGLWLFCAPASWSAKGGARGIYSLASSEDEKRLERCTMSSIGEDLLTVALCPGLRGSDSANDDITPRERRSRAQSSSCLCPQSQSPSRCPGQHDVFYSSAVLFPTPGDVSPGPGAFASVSLP